MDIQYPFITVKHASDTGYPIVSTNVLKTGPKVEPENFRGRGSTGRTDRTGGQAGVPFFFCRNVNLALSNNF